MKEIIDKLLKTKTFYEFLKCIADNPELSMEQDNGWYWLEYNGEKIENSEKERFTNSSEMNDLMVLAGISKPF